jgi:hypothetical protein
MPYYMQIKDPALPGTTTHGQTPPPAGTLPSNKPPYNLPFAFIDKLSIVIDVENEEGITSCLLDYSKEKMEFGWTMGARGAYRFAARLHPPAPKTPTGSQWSKDYMLVQAKPKNGKGGFVRLEWNPSRFSDEQHKWLFDTLDQQLDIVWFHIWKGIVTRADIAVDFPGIHMDHHIFERPKNLIRWPLFKKGVMQTVYMGRQAKGSLRIYDKRAQLGVPGPPLTRVERTTRPKLPAAKLVDLKNPFGNLKVYERAKLDLQRDDPTEALFGMVAADRGLEAALAVFPLAARAEIMERVQATPAPFWKPEEFWAGWTDEVRRVLPAEGMPESSYGLYDKPDPTEPRHQALQ